MNKYLWLTGRVDLKAIEVTIQKLIGSGMNPMTENNPYLGFVYTSFQERATKIAHSNTAKLARADGDKNLSNICIQIASDEQRHEIAYQKSAEGQEAQDFIMPLAGRIRRLAGRAEKRKLKKGKKSAKFSWIHGREVELYP